MNEKTRTLKDENCSSTPRNIDWSPDVNNYYMDPRQNYY